MQAPDPSSPIDTLGITSTEEEIMMHKDMLRRQIIADTKSQAMAAASD